LSNGYQRHPHDGDAMEEIDQHHSRQQLRMAETAIKKGWDIPEQLMSALPKVAGAMAINGSAREKIAAMKVLIAMKEQNDRADPGRQQPQTTINVGVNVDNRTESREALQFLERFREGKLLGEADTDRVRTVREVTQD
jgi:hypothetical protein